MTTPYLVACLVTLRAEFDDLSPNRDKASDGWIGDAAHKAEVSDHNPDAQGRVLAIDIDSTGPWPVPFSDLVDSLVGIGDSRLEYVIWNRRIASRGQGWTWRPYDGTDDPHTSHAHFSARHDHTGNTSTAAWGIEDFMISEDDVKAIWNTDGIVAAPANAASAKTNPFWAPKSFLTDAAAANRDMQKTLDAHTSALAGLSAKLAEILAAVKP